MTIPLLLRGVDLAAFAAALAARLRSAGVLVSASGQGGFVQALRHLAPQTSVALYWAARLTLVNRMEDLGAFDAVMREVFGSVQSGDTRSPESVLPIAGPKTPAATTAGILQPAASQSSNARAERLPWATRTVPDRDGAADAGILVPDLLPSRIAALADDPFDQFDPKDLRLLGSWLEASVQRWPQRRSLRFESSPHGKRIDLRATMNASRRTGWEAVTLARTRPSAGLGASCWSATSAARCSRTPRCICI